MTFRDVFKSSFLEKAAEFSLMDIALAMVLAFAIALFIFYVYKKTFSGVMYSASFGVSIMAMTMITTLIILAVTSNLVLSSVWLAPCPSSASARRSRSLWTRPSSSGQSQLASLSVRD